MPSKYIHLIHHHTLHTKHVHIKGPSMFNGHFLPQNSFTWFSYIPLKNLRFKWIYILLKQVLLLFHFLEKFFVWISVSVYVIITGWVVKDRKGMKTDMTQKTKSWLCKVSIEWITFGNCQSTYLFNHSHGYWFPLITLYKLI